MVGPVLKIKLPINDYIRVLLFSVQLLLLWGRLGNRDVASVLQVFAVKWEVV